MVAKKVRLTVLPPPGKASFAKELKLASIQLAERASPALHPTPIFDDPAVLGLNLTGGCGHRCAFCSIRGHAGYQGDRTLVLYQNTPAQLKAELARRRRLPRPVFMSPGSDPFPPFAEVQAEAARVIQILAERRIESWILTRGFIRPSVMRVLERFAPFVKVTFALTTLDRTLQRQIEPLTAPPRLRLKNIDELRKLGIPVRIAMEPLIPGLTDGRENVAPFLTTLADHGIKDVTVGYLYQRQGIEQNLDPVLEVHNLKGRLAELFESGTWLKAPGMTGARYLPRSFRQRGYAQVMALASPLGIRVSVSGVTNPDFQGPRHPPARLSTQQPLLPLEAPSRPASATPISSLPIPPITPSIL